MKLDFVRKYKEIISYAFFGICTTLVNIVIYFCAARIFELATVSATILAWIGAVAFAYITNKTMVFESRTTKWQEVMWEAATFVSCRLLTGFLDIIIMYVCVESMHMNDMLIKILSNIVVILLNYIASKIIIFKNKQ